MGNGEESETVKLIRRMIAGLMVMTVCAGLDTAGAAETAQAENQAYAGVEASQPFFFPPEQSKWNGLEITVTEWQYLSSEQKEKFVSEYLAEGKQTEGDIGLFLEVLNVFSGDCGEECYGVALTDAIDQLIKEIQ